MLINHANNPKKPLYITIKNRVIWLIADKAIPFFKLWNFHTVLAIAGIVGPIMLSVGDLSAGLTSPNYSIVQNSISSLALTSAGWIQTIGFLTLGLLVEIFTAGLLFNMKSSRGFYMGITIFVFFGFALLLIGAFHTDADGIPDVARTFEGRLHGFVASSAFILFPIAILSLVRSIKNDPNWKYLYSYSWIAIFLGVILVIVIKVLPEGNFLFGLFERLLVANAIIWVEVAGVNMFILSLKRKSNAENLKL